MCTCAPCGGVVEWRKELWGAACRLRAFCSYLCFSLIFYLLPFSVWLLPLKPLFICRSCRDGIFFLARILRRDVPARGSCHLLLFRELLRPLPVCLFCVVRAGFLPCFFALSCLTSFSQTSFHLSLRPRRASTFFRKESRQRFARGRGSAPFEPPFQRPAADLPFSRAAGRLKRPFGRKPPADGETLEKPRSKAQLFKRFCAKEYACALSPISPYFSLLAGLTALRAANRRLARETPEKPRSRAQLFGRFCALGMRRGFRLAGFPPRRREQEVGFLPARENRSPAWARTWKRPCACEARRRKRQGARLARRSRAGDEASCADDPAPGGFCPAGFLPAAGNRRQAFPLSGKTEARRRRAPGMNRVRARRGEEKTRCANCSPQVQKPGAGTHLEKTACVRGWAKIQTRCANCSPQVQKPGAGTHLEKTACVRGWAKIQTRCASCSPQVRVRARPGAGTNTERELPTAGAQARR